MERYKMDNFRLKCPVCERFISVQTGRFAKHRTKRGKKNPYCKMSNKPKYEESEKYA